MSQLTEVKQPLTLTEERVLKLLGSGIAPETVAASIGISASRISQLLSEESFAAAVADLRFQTLSKHNERDASYDELEDKLLERMRDCIPLMHRPMEILKAIQIINQAKRRGTSTPEAITNKQQVINLTIPTQVINQFKVNQQGQVVSVGAQSLITIQSANMESLSKLSLQGEPNDVTVESRAETIGSNRSQTPAALSSK